MATSNSKNQPGKAYTFAAGGWTGVNDQIFPYDDSQEFLTDALNGYLPYPAEGCEFAARPGFALPPISMTANAGMACAMWTHMALNGSIYRFAAIDGKLYRLTGSPVINLATDVTPAGITIDNAAAPTARFSMRSFGDTLIFSDGVNRPWLGTSLASTPITGTYIDIDGSGSAWASPAPPVEYQGSLFFIVSAYSAGIGAVEAGVGLVWCEPNQPSVGYCQPNYADFWNLIQQTGAQIGSLNLRALAATNNGLYYFREYSIGSLQGTPSVNFSSTATTDLVSQNVGTAAPGSVVQWGSNIFFVDTLGRPWMFTEGSGLQAIWQQLRGVISATPSLLANPLATALVGVGCLVPQLNLVVLGGWSGSLTGSPVNGPLGASTLYAFSQDTGVYHGRWTGASTLATFDALAVMKDVNSNPVFVAMCTPAQSLTANTWWQSLLSASNWEDNGVTIPILAQTQRLGYGAATEWTLNMVRVVTSNVTPVTLTVVATNGTIGPYTATPPASGDGTNLAQWAPTQTVGRGVQLQLTPTTTTTQWNLFRAEVDMTAADVQMSDA